MQCAASISITLPTRVRPGNVFLQYNKDIQQFTFYVRFGSFLPV